MKPKRIIKVIKKVKKKKGKDQKSEGQTANITRAPDDHSDGGYSQWREYAEDQWHTMDWPPKGWRPSPWQAAYHDPNSRYYGYNWYDWDNKDWTTPSTDDSSQKSPGTQSTIQDTQTVSSEDGISQQLHRCDTNEQQTPQLETPKTTKTDTTPEKMDTKQKQRNFQEKMDAAARDSMHDKKKGEKEKDKGEKEKEPGDEEEEAESLPQESEDAVAMTEKKAQKLKEKKKEAHARYMRYYRSIRSPCLSYKSKLPPQSIHHACMAPGSGVNTPAELRRMGKKAKGSTLLTGMLEYYDILWLSTVCLGRQSPIKKYSRQNLKLSRAKLDEDQTLKVSRTSCHLGMALLPAVCKILGLLQTTINGGSSPSWSVFFGLEKTGWRRQGAKLNGILFEAWLNCDGQWKSSKFLATIKNRHLKKSSGFRKWLFGWEMNERFGFERAQQIRDWKEGDEDLSLTEVRFHPEMKRVEAGYFV